MLDAWGKEGRVGAKPRRKTQVSLKIISPQVRPQKLWLLGVAPVEPR